MDEWVRVAHLPPCSEFEDAEDGVCQFWVLDDDPDWEAYNAERCRTCEYSSGRWFKDRDVLISTVCYLNEAELGIGRTIHEIGWLDFWLMGAYRGAKDAWRAEKRRLRIRD